MEMKNPRFDGGKRCNLEWTYEMYTMLKWSGGDTCNGASKGVIGPMMQKYKKVPLRVNDALHLDLLSLVLLYFKLALSCIVQASYTNTFAATQRFPMKIVYQAKIHPLMHARPMLASNTKQPPAEVQEGNMSKDIRRVCAQMRQSRHRARYA
jgi:hypothetical protein